MKTKYGVTAVIFDIKDKETYFLLMHRILNWKGWEFVKGGIDKNESPEEAVLREIEEETGLFKLNIISRLNKKMAWASQGIKYEYIPFLIKSDMNEKINLEQEIVEHDDYVWATKEKASDLLTHEDNKKLLKEAIQFLEKQIH
ncbi:MAG: NUDIX domain-containing protein [Candidatus Diapherotrites archaeon]